MPFNHVMQVLMLNWWKFNLIVDSSHFVKPWSL